MQSFDENLSACLLNPYHFYISMKRRHAECVFINVYRRYNIPIERDLNDLTIEPICLANDYLLICSCVYHGTIYMLYALKHFPMVVNFHAERSKYIISMFNLQSLNWNGMIHMRCLRWVVVVTVCYISLPLITPRFLWLVASYKTFPNCLTWTRKRANLEKKGENECGTESRERERESEWRKGWCALALSSTHFPYCCSDLFRMCHPLYNSIAMYSHRAHTDFVVPRDIC